MNHLLIDYTDFFNDLLLSKMPNTSPNLSSTCRTTLRSLKETKKMVSMIGGLHDFFRVSDDKLMKAIDAHSTEHIDIVQAKHKLGALKDAYSTLRQNSVELCIALGWEKGKDFTESELQQQKALPEDLLEAFSKSKEQFEKVAYDLRSQVCSFSDSLYVSRDRISLRVCLENILEKLIWYHPNNAIEGIYYEDPVSYETIPLQYAVTLGKSIIDMRGLHRHLLAVTPKNIVYDREINGRKIVIHGNFDYFNTSLPCERLFSLLAAFQSLELELFPRPILIGLLNKGSDFFSSLLILVHDEDMEFFTKLGATAISHSALPCCHLIQDHGGSLEFHIAPFMRFLVRNNTAREDFPEIYRLLKDIARRTKAKPVDDFLYQLDEISKLTRARFDNASGYAICKLKENWDSEYEMYEETASDRMKEYHHVMAREREEHRALELRIRQGLCM